MHDLLGAILNDAAFRILDGSGCGLWLLGIRFEAPGGDWQLAPPPRLMRRVLFSGNNKTWVLLLFHEIVVYISAHT
jgi:hypothetical protein